MSPSIETEVKIAFASAKAARDAILAAGGVERRARYFEDNRIFDNPARDLSARSALLRVRETSDGRGRLTYKEKIPGPARSKVRREWEVSVEPAKVLAEILAGAGFGVIYRYQKYRTGFRIADCAVELDETPIGCFVEVEGPDESIHRIASELGAPPAEICTEDYRSLHMAWLESRGLPAGDMVFPEGGSSTGSAGA